MTSNPFVHWAEQSAIKLSPKHIPSVYYGIEDTAAAAYRTNMPVVMRTQRDLRRFAWIGHTLRQHQKMPRPENGREGLVLQTCTCTIVDVRGRRVVRK